MSADAISRLAAHGYELLVDPAHGGSLAALRWRKPDGVWFDLLETCPPAEIARTGGCFVMAPFANRLDGGRFRTEDGMVSVPLNRTDLGLAIHGFSRDRHWTIEKATATTLTLSDNFADAGVPFAYRLIQRIALGESGVELGLSLTNTAERALPYGFGFHPWFCKDEAMWLIVEAAGVLDRDARGFPTAPARGPDFSAGADASNMPWFDGHLTGWNSRHALIEWRRAGVALHLRASGALSNLHVYVPDVHNRRDLAGYGDLAWLAPGETMHGAMELSAGALAPR